jgi:outer membrane lipoprotein SlyB
MMEINQVPNTVPNSGTSPSYQPGLPARMQHSMALVAIVAVLGVTVMALAAALVVNRSEAQPGLAASTPAPLVSTAPAPVTRLVAEAPKPMPAVGKRSAVHSPVPAQSSHASYCADCATVEAVTAVQRQGQVNGVAVGNQTIGLGTVAGGLIGGLLGHQVGGGNGKTLATVAGVAGGAFAGNTIEKNMKKVTVYDVRLRMDDGSRRNMEVSSVLPVGSKVIVEGKNLRMANTAG